jgi:hypothetical protein
MAPLEQHPPHIRKKIALVCTFGFAFILLIVMIFIYTRPDAKKDSGAGSQITQFYTTILTKAQSYVTQE